MRRAVIIVIVLACLMVSGSAQDDPFPALTALAEVEMPPRDRLQLARELLGVSVVPPPLTEPVAYSVGDRRLFNVRDSAESRLAPVEAELYALGNSIAVWVDTRAQNVDSGDVAALASEFDMTIYPKLRELWGSERTPGIDGDPRIVVLFTYDVAPSIAGYYISLHSLPVAIEPNSNEVELIIFNLNAYGGVFNSPYVFSLMSHEFQHMIRENVTANGHTWLNEGLSVFTEWLMDYAPVGLTFRSALFEPRTQLNTWNSTGANYGMAGLFVTYVYERFGIEGVRALSYADGLDIDVVEQALAAIGAESDAATLYADFAAATWLRNTTTDPRWGYPSVPGLIRPYSKAESLGTFERVTPPYALEYVTLPDALRGQTLTVTAAFDDTARLIPTAPASGAYMWAALRQDNSAPTLTRTFDLREATQAELAYRVWYDLEMAYDYGFVQVSTDDGVTWDVLSTRQMIGRSLYGAGYTGTSTGWIEQTIDLNAYIGTTILVRFMVITDDALNKPGLAIDDIRLSDAGYASDVEQDDGGWEARGWVRTDNRLPAQLWMQVLQQRPGGVDVQRVLSNGDDTLSAFIYDDTTSIALAFSPVIPITTEPLVYAVTVAVE